MKSAPLTQTNNNHVQEQKLSKHQRYYRKKKLSEKQDFEYTHPESPRSSIRATRRCLSIRVSLAASQRLIGLSERESIYQSYMLNRIIMRGIQQVLNVSPSLYKQLSTDNSKLNRYQWNKELLDATGIKKRYKRAKSNVQLNLPISSTAWKSLHCCSNDIKLSKARIVQCLILNYEPTPIHVRLKQKKSRKLFKDYYKDTIPSIDY